MIVQSGGIPLIIQCLSSPVRNTVDQFLNPNIRCWSWVLLWREKCIPNNVIETNALFYCQVSYALAALYYLCDPDTKAEILKPEVIELIRRYSSAEAVNVTFSNLAKSFLDKHVDRSSWSIDSWPRIWVLQHWSPGVRPWINWPTHTHQRNAWRAKCLRGKFTSIWFLRSII